VRELMNKYVVLYDRKIGPFVLVRDCSHVSLMAENKPGVDAMYEAVAKERSGRMKGIEVTGMVELREGERYKIPRIRLWPFTSKLFDRTFEHENEERSGFIYIRYDRGCEEA
jgi:hypothetical protein